MSFASYFKSHHDHSKNGFSKENMADIRSALLRRFTSLLEPKPPEVLLAMQRQAEQLTRQYFGRTMRFFAPIYLSNECVNACQYCGFSRSNPSPRITLTVEQVEAEAQFLIDQGFRSLLLVAGEHPKFVSRDYLVQCIQRARKLAPSISLEIGPLETKDYIPLVEAGAEGLVIYQETYDREIYARLHPIGPKRDFDWRLECPERAAAAGFKRVGIGALIGLAPWRDDMTALATHAEYLLKHCWKTFLTISLPRLRPAAGGFQPPHAMTDDEMVQLVCALRICFPQVGLVLSTREPDSLRNRLFCLGITLISAGSQTEPGGYTGAGQALDQRVIPSEGEHGMSTEQFATADNRTPDEVARFLRTLNLEPVWKDWERF